LIQKAIFGVDIRRDLRVSEEGREGIGGRLQPLARHGFEKLGGRIGRPREGVTKLDQCGDHFFRILIEQIEEEAIGMLRLDSVARERGKRCGSPTSRFFCYGATLGS